MNLNIYDVIIVGGGISGLTSAIYTSRGGLKTLLFAGILSGGALTTTTLVENYPGFVDGIDGIDLIENCKKQAIKFETEYLEKDVVSVNLNHTIKKLYTEEGKEYQSLSVIIATGSSYKKLNIEGESRLSGHGVSWCATCDGYFFRGKDVIVVGGGDSAAEEALFLSKHCNSVKLVHRRDELRASKIMQRRIFNEKKIEFIKSTVLLSINGDKLVESVKLKNLKTDTTSVIKIDGVFVAIGHVPNSKIFESVLPVVSKSKHLVHVSNSSRTNIDGVFVAGDVSDSKYMQAVTAAGYGCMAAIDTIEYVDSYKRDK